MSKSAEADIYFRNCILECFDDAQHGAEVEEAIKQFCDRMRELLGDDLYGQIAAARAVAKELVPDA